MKYAFYTDNLNGWLKVPIEEIKQLGLLKEISNKSYVSACHKFAFLNKNVDAETFVIETIAAGWFESFKAVERCTSLFYSAPPNFIQKLDPFDGSMLTGKSLPAKNADHIHDF